MNFSPRTTPAATPPLTTVELQPDARAPAPAQSPAPWVVLAEDALDLEPHRPAWDALAAALPEPNPFYESWMLLPAVKRLGADADLVIALVYAADPSHTPGPPRLIGLFPLERVRRYRGLPCAALRLWQHVHCFDCTPLVRPGCADQALAALLDWLAHHRLGTPLLELPTLSSDGYFAQALADFIFKRDLPCHGIEEYSRAILRPRANANAYLTEALANKRRKELERLERRLAELGCLEHALLEDPAQAERWIDDFLALEASGWKGQEGSALGQHAAERSYFQELARGAAERGRLLFSALRLDGRAIAMKCSFRAGAGAYAFKIAFDEAYARFSPGVLLELDNIRRLHDAPAIRWMDSCAVSDHVMINRIWLDRRMVRTQLLATGRRGSHFLLALVPLLKWAKNLFRRRLRPEPLPETTP